MDGVYDLDTMMGYLGDFGRYQMWQFSLHILSAVTAGLHMLSLVTVAAVPDHRCAVNDIDINGTMSNLTGSALRRYVPFTATGEPESCLLFNSANESVACNSWVYNKTYYQSSRAIEWNFVCDQRWMGAVAQSMYMFGVFTGSLVLGNLADKYGRKPIFCWSALLQLIIGVAVAFTPEYYTFLVLRYLYGIFGSAGSYIPGFVLTMELVGPSRRSMCGVAFQAAFATGIMLVAGWGAAIKDRQILQVIYGLHSLLLVAHWWIMDESPRWLWANGRIPESVAIVKKALKMNKSPISLERAEFVANKPKLRSDEGNSKDGGVLDLFRTPNLRKKTLNVCLCFFANSLVYYGLSLSTGKLQGDPYFNLFLTGLVELPSYVITVYLMDKLGRRPIIAFDMLIGGLCCIIASIMPMGSTISIVFVMIGKFLIASSFAIIFNYAAELFPTVVRNSALGIGAMCARTSGAMTPLITLLDSFDPKLPSIIFAVIAIISGFLTLWLPETLNKPMPQTMEEGERFGKGETCFTICCRKEEEFDDVSVEKPKSEQMEPLNKLR